MPIDTNPAAARGWPVDDRALQRSGAPLISRRDILRTAGLALAAAFTALRDGLLLWLMRACRFDVGDLRSAAAR